MALRLHNVRAALAQARALVANYQRLGLEPGPDVLVVILGCKLILAHHRRRRRRRRHRTAHLGLSFMAVEKGRSQMNPAPLTIAPTQDVLCQLHPVDPAGNPTTPTGVVWSSSNPAVVALTPAADGLSAVGVSLSEGVATLTAHLPGGAGQAAISEEGVVTVGTVTPPPPVATASLGLTLAAVDKQA